MSRPQRRPSRLGQVAGRRHQAVLAVIVIALAVTAGCAQVVSEDRDGADRDATDGSGAYTDPDTGDGGGRNGSGRRGEGSEPDPGGGGARDPIAPPARDEPTAREWDEVFFDDFDDLDTAVWRTYDGVPGCCPDALWDPDMVRVEDSSLFLDTARVDGRWRSGGVGSWDSPLERQYGRWDVRVRTDDDALGVTVGALLWPAYGGWPPEIDFYEIFATEQDRREITITNHHGDIEADGSHDATRRPVRADFARWRVMSVRWTPDEIQVVMDGRAVETIRRDEQIPDVPMWLALQTAMRQVRGEDPTFEGTRSMQVDWVRAFEPAGSS